MTVSSVLPIKTHTYTGAGVYGVTYPVLDVDTIFVKLSLNTGNTVDLMAITDFTVEILPEDGGANITVLNTAYNSTGVSLEIRRILTIEQTTEWDNGSALDMPLLTQSFDRVIMLMQQISTDLSSYAATTNWRGAWATNQHYTLNNIIEAPNGSWYVAVVDHISDAFDSDLVAGNWFLVLDIVYIEQLTAQSAQSSSESSVSAAAALASELAAASSESVCDADVVLTHADVVLTHADAAATAIDKAAAAASAATAANIVIQGERVDAIYTDSYVTTLGQVEFTVTKPAPVDNILVFLNSRKLKVTEDYTVDDDLVVGLVTLASGAGLGDELDILSFNTVGLAQTVTDAETAQGLAEDARDAAVIAQGLAEDARDAALVASVPLTANVTVTVGPGGDYATINAAIAGLCAAYRGPLFNGANTPVATISLLTGFVMNEQVLVKNLDLSWITITSVDATVSLLRSGLSTELYGLYTAFCLHRSTGPVIACKFVVDSSAGSATSRAFAYVIGVNAKLIIEGSGKGCSATSGGLEFGVYCAQGSCAELYGGAVTGFVTNLTSIGGTVFAQWATLTGAIYHSVIGYGGNIYISNASCRMGAGNSPDDISANNGCIISATSATGGVSQTANTPTANGIIFQ